MRKLLTHEERCAYKRAWYHKTKHLRRDVLKAYDHKSYRKHREKRLERSRAWAQKNRAWRSKYEQARSLMRYFGITVEQYEAISESQGRVCAICKNTCLTGRRLSVDHCHSTRFVRGLLCGNCNKGLGNFRDSISILTSAITYLTKSPAIAIPTAVKGRIEIRRRKIKPKETEPAETEGAPA